MEGRIFGDGGGFGFAIDSGCGRKDEATDIGREHCFQKA